MFSSLADKIESHRSSSHVFWRLLLSGKDFAYTTFVRRYRAYSKHTRGMWKWRLGGLFVSNRKYAKFIILGHPRTGSTLLMTLLRSHPHILVHGELFHPLPKNPQGADVDLLRRISPAGVFRWLIFRPHRSVVKAVGFKILYGHGWWSQKYSDSADPHREYVWSYLRSLSDLKIIQITRKNVLRSVISSEIASVTHRWHLQPDENPYLVKVPIDCSKICARLASLQKENSSFLEFFAGHDIIKVHYEDLATDPDRAMEKVQMFLGLPAKQLYSVNKKQNPYRISEMVENYDELVATLSGTEWEWCLSADDCGAV